MIKGHYSIIYFDQWQSNGFILLVLHPHCFHDAEILWLTHLWTKCQDLLRYGLYHSLTSTPVSRDDVRTKPSLNILVVKTGGQRSYYFCCCFWKRLVNKELVCQRSWSHFWWNLSYHMKYTISIIVLYSISVNNPVRRNIVRMRKVFTVSFFFSLPGNL